MTLPDPAPVDFTIPPAGLMHHTQRMEQFNQSYVLALASAAGYTVMNPPVDDDSIDAIIKSRAKHGILKSPSIDMQLKATSTLDVNAGNFVYDLKVKNYHDLRNVDVAAPRILVVMHVPLDCDEWVKCTEERIEMQKRAYWVSLKGQPDTRNQNTVRIEIPRTNILDVSSLHVLMNKAGRNLPL